MKLIKCLAHMIHEELEDAEKYAEEAVKWKEDDERLAEIFYSLSKAELEHANLENEHAMRIIKEHHDEFPEEIDAIWEWEREKSIKHTAMVKSLHEMYKS